MRTNTNNTNTSTEYLYYNYSCCNINIRIPYIHCTWFKIPNTSTVSERGIELSVYHYHNYYTVCIYIIANDEDHSIPTVWSFGALCWIIRTNTGYMMQYLQLRSALLFWSHLRVGVYPIDYSHLREMQRPRGDTTRPTDWGWWLRVGDGGTSIFSVSRPPTSLFFCLS